jgi:hypothetical protein
MNNEAPTADQLFPDAKFRPIDDEAMNGRPYLVRRGGEFAKARFHRAERKTVAGGTWIYALPGAQLHEIDFVPLEYAELQGSGR